MMMRISSGGTWDNGGSRGLGGMTRGRIWISGRETVIRESRTC